MSFLFMFFVYITFCLAVFSLKYFKYGLILDQKKQYKKKSNLSPKQSQQTLQILPQVAA